MSEAQKPTTSAVSPQAKEGSPNTASGGSQQTKPKSEVLSKIVKRWGGQLPFSNSQNESSIASLHGLELLIGENAMFIHRTENEYDGDYIDSSHIYDILSSAGERLFSAVKTFEYENCDRMLQLDVSILECEGDGVISIKADSAKIHVRPLSGEPVGDFQEEMGLVLNRKNGFWSNHELDVFVEGKKEFQIIRTPEKLNMRGEFTLIRVEDGVKCGEIGLKNTADRIRSRSSLSSQSSLASSPKYGMEFTEDLPVNQKAVLLGAMIFLYFENFDSISGALRPGSFTFDRICCFIFGILFFIITIIFLVIVFLRLTDSVGD